jgi:hypothetical protein
MHKYGAQHQKMVDKKISEYGIEKQRVKVRNITFKTKETQVVIDRKEVKLTKYVNISIIKDKRTLVILRASRPKKPLNGFAHMI